MPNPISVVITVGSKIFASSHFGEEFAEELEGFGSEFMVFSLLSMSEYIFLKDNDSEGQYVSQKRFLAW
jgi:hypothetical protein